MIVHLNGQLVSANDAQISVFDRGFLFGDGIYEGLRATRGHIISLDRHIRRMRAGLDETRITGFEPESLGQLSVDLLAANDLDSAFLYWQVTRGTPEDGHARPRIPTPGTQPTVLGFATSMPSLDECTEPEVRSAVVLPDVRWHLGHIKSISLLGNVLSAIEADEAGAQDAILHRNGVVTEATATNVIAVIDGVIITPALQSASFLHGVTRNVLLESDPSIREEVLSVDQLSRADEIILVGTRTLVGSVIALDGKQVGAGVPGPQARRLLSLLRQRVAAQAQEAAHV